MFTDKGQALIDLAKDYAFSSGAKDLQLSAILTAVGKSNEATVLLGECLGLPADRARALCPDLPDPMACPGKMPLTDPVRDMLRVAKELTEDIPDRFHPGLIDLRHIVCALALSRDACALLNVTAMARDDALALLASWYEQESRVQLKDLTERLRAMRAELLSKIFGQDHAVHAFVEGLFNAEVVAAADTDRRAPRALFVFAGPPGVGKTYLAETGAAHLGRPFKRFDMTAYANRQNEEALVGSNKAYRGSHPGILTEFVEKNPNAVLLFDEIEKAHLDTIQLFLQILDAGRLEDKFHERDVSFRDTTIIFTTNAGRKLYDRPNESGVHAANATFHRKTILDALANEKDPLSQHIGAGDAGRALFPPALCSRLATGYPVLFNHLRVNEIERVARTELARVARLMERQYYKQTVFDELLAVSLVLREGAQTDARTLRSQTEAFVKSEIFKFCQLFNTDRLEEVFSEVDSVHFVVDQDPARVQPEVRALFEPPGLAKVLLVADRNLTDLYRQYIVEVDWRSAESADDALEVLANEEMDLVLVDLWLGKLAAATLAPIPVGDDVFTFVPAASSGLERGQEVLRKIRDRLPNLSVYLLSLTDAGGDDTTASIDDELFLACVRAGGARGMLVSRFVDATSPDWSQRRDCLADSLVETCRRLHRERAADRLGQERKVLGFDTLPEVSRGARRISIRLINLRLIRAVSAADSGEVLDEVERPATRFADVIGADEAKKELQFFIEYLKNPRRFMALGLDPPKGVLLHGPPGTGKTMLARAMAGESNVAFIPADASGFVTLWQGSGAQHVRDLFERGRRYAPSIIFIDEIDAIGKTRTGSPGAGHSEEVALNALLTEMDGFTSPSPDRPVFLLAATNFEVDDEEDDGQTSQHKKIDPALRRRFTRLIKVDLPERAAREQYLTRRLAQRRGCTVTPAAIKSVADLSSGMSLSDLARVIEAASRSAVRAGVTLDDRILTDAFEEVKYGTARARDPSAVERTSRHEAGHTVMYWIQGYWAPHVTVVSRGDYGGYMAHSSAELEQGLGTRNALLGRIRTCLGGRAAELLFYGPDGGLSFGASKDLRMAGGIAKRMACQFGMESDFGLAVAPELMTHEAALGSPLHSLLHQVTGRILKEQMAETVKLLEANRQHLDNVAAELIQKELLNEDDLKRILPASPGMTP